MRFLSAVEGLIVDHHTRGMLTVIPFYTMDDKKSGLQMQVCQWFDELAISVGVLSQLRVLVPSEIIQRGAESFLNCSLQPSQLSNTSWSVSCFTWQRAPSSTGNVGVLHPTLTDGEGRSKAKEVEPCFGFQTVSLEG